MSTYVALYAKGMFREVMRVITAINDELGSAGRVWRDARHDPQGDDSEYQPYDGWFDVEIVGNLRRDEANQRLGAIVAKIDPDLEVIKEGDIFKMPI